jgi:hypothetical protein
VQHCHQASRVSASYHTTELPSYSCLTRSVQHASAKRYERLLKAHNIKKDGSKTDAPSPAPKKPSAKKAVTGKRNNPGEDEESVKGEEAAEEKKPAAKKPRTSKAKVKKEETATADDDMDNKQKQGAVKSEVKDETKPKGKAVKKKEDSEKKKTAGSLHSLPTGDIPKMRGGGDNSRGQHDGSTFDLEAMTDADCEADDDKDDESCIICGTPKSPLFQSSSSSPSPSAANVSPTSTIL